MLSNIADSVKTSETGLPDASAWMELLRLKVEKAAMDKNDMGTIEKMIEESVKVVVRNPLIQPRMSRMARITPLLLSVFIREIRGYFF